MWECNLNSHRDGRSQYGGVSEQSSEESSVKCIPTASSFFFFPFRRPSLYRQCLKCTAVLHFHDLICCITTSAEVCFITIARVCLFTALFIICVQRTVKRRCVVQWKNIHVQCMIKPLSAGLVQHISSWSCTTTIHYTSCWSCERCRKVYIATRILRVCVGCWDNFTWRNSP